jgi:hypothetical protein
MARLCLAIIASAKFAKKNESSKYQENGECVYNYRNLLFLRHL